MQCDGLLQRFQRKVKKAPGIGVVMSAAVYRRLTGMTFVVGDTVSRLGLNGRMPRPLLGVHSGKTTITRFGLSLTNVSTSTRRAFAPGIFCGA